MRMRPVSGSVVYVIPEAMRVAASQKLLAAAELPRAVRKSLAVLLFLVVAAFTISGGTLSLAALMHAVVQRLDMPPQVPYSRYGAAIRLYQAQHPATKSGLEPVFIVPRPTVAGTLDHIVTRATDPAAPLISQDAAGIGLFLTRQVHALLVHVLDNATRSRLQGPGLWSGVPITGGE